MKIYFNDVTKKYEWVADRWYDKAVIVMGYLYFAAFFIGIAAGIASGF